MTQSLAITTPVYNGAAFIRYALDSALEQRRPADQIVVVDDASTDATPQILQSYQDRVKVERLAERVPAPAAWNEAVRRTSSDFVLVLAHDDVLCPDFIECWESTVLTDPAIDLLITGHEVIDSSGSTTGVQEICTSGV